MAYYYRGCLFVIRLAVNWRYESADSLLSSILRSMLRRIIIIIIEREQRKRLTFSVYCFMIFPQLKTKQTCWQKKFTVERSIYHSLISQCTKPTRFTVRTHKWEKDQYNNIEKKWNRNKKTRMNMIEHAFGCWANTLWRRCKRQENARKR